MTDGSTDLLVGSDRHGDLTHLHTPAGTVTDTVVYDPYGTPLTTTGTFATSLGFQGDWTEPETGQVWMGARWYQPNTAGFTSRDTILGELTTPVSLNRYTYAAANPLGYWDPDGHVALAGGGGNALAAPTTVQLQAMMVTAEKSQLTAARQDTVTATVKARQAQQIQDDRLALDPDMRDWMADYLAGRGALPTGWEGATDRARYNVFAWTLLANTGRTSLNQSEFAALSNNEWLQMWADQGEAALGDVYQRECNVICQNKGAIESVLKGIIVAGVAVATAGAAAPALAGTGLVGTGVGAFGVGYGSGAASGLASSLTGQTLNQSFSFEQTARDTFFTASVGGATSWLAEMAMTRGLGSALDDGTKASDELIFHSRYSDGTPVMEGQQPPRLGGARPDPSAAGPHARLRWDWINNRVYQAREFDSYGNPVRDIDFTGPTFPNGTMRPGHWIPEQHLWSVNDPAVGPKSGWVRGPGQPW